MSDAAQRRLHDFYDPDASLERRVTALIGWWRSCAIQSAEDEWSVITVMAAQLERVVTLPDARPPSRWRRARLRLLGR